jgi:hypothetical protein
LGTRGFGLIAAHYWRKSKQHWRNDMKSKLTADEKEKKLWQVPEVGTYHLSSEDPRPCLVFGKGKPHNTVLDIVRHYGFRFCWDQLIWWLPSGRMRLQPNVGGGSDKAHAEDCSHTIALLVRQIEGGASVGMAHRLIRPKLHKSRVRESRVQDTPMWPADTINYALGGASVNYALETKESNLREAVAKSLVAARQKLKAAQAEVVALKAIIEHKDAHIAVLKSEAHGRSAAEEAKVRPRNIIYCQNDEDY